MIWGWVRFWLQMHWRERGRGRENKKKQKQNTQTKRKTYNTSISLLACSRNTWAYSLTSFSLPFLAASMRTRRGTLVSRKESETWSITALRSCEIRWFFEKVLECPWCISFTYRLMSTTAFLNYRLHPDIMRDKSLLRFAGKLQKAEVKKKNIWFVFFQ